MFAVPGLRSAISDPRSKIDTSPYLRAGYGHVLEKYFVPGTFSNENSLQPIALGAVDGNCGKWNKWKGGKDSKLISGSAAKHGGRVI